MFPALVACRAADRPGRVIPRKRKRHMTSKRHTLKAAVAALGRSVVQPGAQGQEQLGLRHTQQHNMTPQDKAEQKELRQGGRRQSARDARPE
jgi:hypothetical protein